MKLYWRRFDFFGFLRISPVSIILGKTFYMVLLCHSCFPVLNVNLPFLNHFNKKDFRLFWVNWNICVLFKLLHMHARGRFFWFNWNWMRFICLSTEQNRTNRVNWDRLVQLSSEIIIELTEKFHFDHVQVPNQSKNNLTDCVWLIFASVSFNQQPQDKKSRGE